MPKAIMCLEFSVGKSDSPGQTSVAKNFIITEGGRGEGVRWLPASLAPSQTNTYPDLKFTSACGHSTQPRTKKKGFLSHASECAMWSIFFLKVIFEKCVFDVNVGTYLRWQINWMRKCGDRRKDSVMVTVWVFHDSQSSRGSWRHTAFHCGHRVNRRAGSLTF